MSYSARQEVQRFVERARHRTAGPDLRAVGNEGHLLPVVPALAVALLALGREGQLVGAAHDDPAGRPLFHFRPALDDLPPFVGGVGEGLQRAQVLAHLLEHRVALGFRRFRRQRFWRPVAAGGHDHGRGNEQTHCRSRYRHDFPSWFRATAARILDRLRLWRWHPKTSTRGGASYEPVRERLTSTSGRLGRCVARRRRQAPGQCPGR